MGCPEYTRSDYMRLVADESNTLYKRFSHTVSDDPIGNRINYQDMSYAYNKLNQLVSVKSDASSSPLPYHYDDWGNLLKTPEWTYKYDLHNRLIEAKKRDGKVTVKYSYDPLGQRIKSVCGEKKTKFLMYGMVEQARVVNEENMFHTMGLDVFNYLKFSGGIGAYLASSLEKKKINYLYDGNGNVTNTAGLSKKFKEDIIYSPFGKIDQGVKLAFNFSSKASDLSGLNYFGHRFYSPQLGRWLNRDPIREHGGDNLYNTLQNDTINNYDILGLSTADGCCSSGSPNHLVMSQLPFGAKPTIQQPSTPAAPTGDPNFWRVLGGNPSTYQRSRKIGSITYLDGSKCIEWADFTIYDYRYQWAAPLDPTPSIPAGWEPVYGYDNNGQLTDISLYIIYYAQDGESYYLLPE